MVLLILRRISTGLKIKAWIEDQARITDIMRDMHITPANHARIRKGQVHHVLRNGDIQGRVTMAKGWVV
jgi:hypothetical protein